MALVQSFARVEAEVMGLRMVVERLLGAQMPVLSWWAIMTVLTRAATTITLLSIFLLGTWLFFHGLATIGEIVMFMSFATMLVQKLEQVSGFINSVFMVAPRLQEFFDVLDTTPAVRDTPNAIDPGRLKGEVSFEDVSFSYDGKRPAIADLNSPRETRRSHRAGRPDRRRQDHRARAPASRIRSAIRSHHHRRRRSARNEAAALRRNIGVVFQEVLLFNRSIRENLTVGKPDATDAEMLEALRRAQAIDFVERNPDKLNAIVGERGRFLSGGERQRLSIARALLKNPPILILDEATSALDAQTETKVQAALDEVMKDRTTFVIAHRLATIRNATRILVFRDGRVIEAGNFDELVQQDGAFAELARSQFLVREKQETQAEDAAE